MAHWVRRGFGEASFCGLMSLVAAGCFCGVAPGQETTPAGAVEGHVTCSDTHAPGRYAVVVLQRVSSVERDAAGAVPAAPAAAKAGDDSEDDDAGDAEDGDKRTPAMRASDTVGADGNYLTHAGLDGGFTLAGVAPGKYYVSATLAGYGSPYLTLAMGSTATDIARWVQAQGVTVSVAANGVSHMEVELVRGAVIAGRVLYDDGSPGIGVTVKLLRRPVTVDANGAAVAGKFEEVGVMWQTDDTGAFRFAGLPAGEYTVSAALPFLLAPPVGMLGKPGMRFEDANGGALKVYFGDGFRLSGAKVIQLGAGEARVDTNIGIATAGFRAVSGMVVRKSDQKPMKRGSVTLYDAQDGTELRMASIRPDGSFSFQAVPEGMYTMVTRGDDGTDAKYVELRQPLAVQGDVVGMMVGVERAKEKP